MHFAMFYLVDFSFAGMDDAEEMDCVLNGGCDYQNRRRG